MAWESWRVRGNWKSTFSSKLLSELYSPNLVLQRADKHLPQLTIKALMPFSTQAIETFNTIKTTLQLDPTSNTIMTSTSWSNSWLKFKLEDHFLLFEGKFYVPEKAQLEVSILQSFHNFPLAGHHNQSQTLFLVCCDTHWQGMTSYVNNYLSSFECILMDATKPGTILSMASTQWPQPLPVPKVLWQFLSMDQNTFPPLTLILCSLLFLTEWKK